MDSELDRILAYLNREKVRATYGAVGEVLGVPAQAVGLVLGNRRPEASWVVSTRSGRPTDYQRDQMDPGLTKNPHIIRSGMELRRRLRGQHTGGKAS